MGPIRLFERALRAFGGEDSMFFVRWRLWKADWFPYRTAKLLGVDEETGEMKLGPWKWNRPMKLRRRGR